MGILNIKLGKKEIIGGLALGIVITICTFLFLKFTNKDIYYQVIFDSNGGTEVAGQNVLIGTNVKAPNQTTKEGYTFIGWYNGTEKFDFNSKIKEDIVLTAKWEKIKTEKPNQEKKEETKQEEKKEESQPKSREQKKQEIPQTPTIIKASNISLDTTNLTMKIGEQRTLTAQISPDNTTNKSITWVSTNPNVASVNNGTIVANNSGTAIITATIDDKIATCSVTVEKNITYNYEIIDTPGSAIGQCNIYIKSSEGVHVSGTLRINYAGGGSETINITPEGIIRIRNIIESITIISAG